MPAQRHSPHPNRRLRPISSGKPASSTTREPSDQRRSAPTGTKWCWEFQPATIMTDPSCRQAYVEPLTLAYLEEIIRKERRRAAFTVRPDRPHLSVWPTPASSTVWRGADRAKIDAIKKAEDACCSKTPCGRSAWKRRSRSLSPPSKTARRSPSASATPASAPQLHAGRHRRRIAYNREELEEILGRAWCSRRCTKC